MSEKDEISRAITNCMHEIEKMPQYIENNKAMKEMSNNLQSELSEKQKKQFKEILKLQGILKGYEAYAIYKVGFANGIKSK